MKIKEVLEEFKKEIEKLYGDRLKEITLYGSYAGGDATEDSDIRFAHGEISEEC